MRLLFLGLSLSSSWGNGHATTYRALLRGLAERGHELHFLERNRPWYAANRDLPAPDFCSLAFYDSPADLQQWRGLAARADAIIIGSYVPEVTAWADANRQGLLCFYDIDTPVTLRKLAGDDFEYLSPHMIPLFDLYLSFTGGPMLRTLQSEYGARRTAVLYCSVDPRRYQPVATARRWDLGYLGTYSADRQPGLQRLLIDVALQCPQYRFVVAGPQFPADIAWPDNVDRIEHLPPDDHAAFYSSLRWTLNITRADMVQAGYSPSVRLFEATACGVPVITDPWPGLADVFEPGDEMIIARSSADVIATLALPASRRDAVGLAGRTRTLAQHTGIERAGELEGLLSKQSGRRMADGMTDARQGEAVPPFG